MGEAHTVHVNGHDILMEDQGDEGFTIYVADAPSHPLWHRRIKGWVECGHCKRGKFDGVMTEDAFLVMVCGLKADDKGMYPWNEMNSNPEYRHFKATFHWHCDHYDRSGGPGMTWEEYKQKTGAKRPSLETKDARAEVRDVKVREQFVKHRRGR